MYAVSDTLLARNRSRPASEKISIEARKAANASIGGLLSCQPSAPAMG